MTDPGLSDHFLMLSDIKVWRPKPDIKRYAFRDFRAVNPVDFAAKLLTTDAYVNAAADVDGFCDQIQSSVTAVLDSLAHIQTRTKRHGKRINRWLSDAATPTARASLETNRC